ncbi:hypothetical protein ACTXN4_09635 [Pseudomonas helleri]|uniref:Uncharacterized protein n=1 Tax=Pseudomonas helleri TaxID=1608996 RepID=A0A7X1WRW2_9PSED|nr:MULTISPECIES: hypothetical protein [Pseudomonas]MQT73303.1 hypothetical protein [Pseudomonas helleri]
MVEAKNSLIGVLVMAPLFFMGWCGLSYMWLGFVPEGNLRTSVLVTASCVVIGAWFVWTKRKAVRNRVYLHVKPNIIEVESAELFSGEFSSETRFLVSTEAFQKTLQAVVVRESYTQGRFMFPRESAYVRIWPGALGVTELELEAIEQALTEEFIELEIEVMERTPGHGSHDTAIKA